MGSIRIPPKILGGKLMEISNNELKLIAGLRDRLGEEYEFNINEIKKVNYKYKGLTIRKKGLNIAPTINLEEVAEDLTEENSNEIVSSLCDVILNGIDRDVDISKFTKWDNIKDCIHTRLINYEKNITFLEDTPHIRYLDLAVVFYIDCNSLCGLENGCILITNDHLGIWDKAVNDLLDSVRNQNDDFVMRNMFDFVNKMIFQDYNDTPDMFEDRVFVCTNKQQMYGASVIFNNKNLREISNILSDDFYIIPSSVHEVLVIKKENVDEIENLKMIINEVNRTVLSTLDYLSDSLYFYNRKNGEVVIV